MERLTIGKWAILVVIVISVFLINQRAFNISPEDIRNLIYTAGWLAPVVYIFLYALRPLVLFPASIFSIVAGLAFGVYLGVIFALIGATLSAILAFVVANRFGEKAVRFHKKGKTEYYRQKFEEKGFLYILMLRLIPVINFDLISYTAGLAKVKLADFVKATIVGIIPGTVVYSLVGASLVDGNVMTIIGTVTLFVIVIVIPLIWNNKFMRVIEDLKPD
ncbi:TVP38/TMEM64 family protein [Alkalibacillus haloalkaliphilus]|uniref:TVP38/TMEM64 family membrane protein n=1 Tax=Alkalibacillus haloalkaliphilus TaxID=94136 RepID=A0A511W7W0_9BACI|nr:TVP38/TMEM64 family protein [Alkalibacillus haloalkaliphilus]GEN47106.1 TVP38/TMEM64 family membrane protein YtxB [Alkalibacillus haloalkaliphilus]